jgi:hypothetical protein
MEHDPAREILIAGAGALAHGNGLGPTLQVVLESIAAPLGIASAAIFVVDANRARLELAASVGLAGPALDGLVAAVANQEHPVARTVAAGIASFDVLPTAPGGPALRSHLPLTIRRRDGDAIVGVLAVAHDQPIDLRARALLQAGADLSAVAVERSRA